MEVEGEWGEGDWGGGEEGGGEGWETVTEEGEEWARLQLRLEVLTCLCGVVGMAVVSRAPSLPLLRKTTGETQEETQSGGEGEYQYRDACCCLHTSTQHVCDMYSVYNALFLMAEPFNIGTLIGTWA